MSARRDYAAGRALNVQFTSAPTRALVPAHRSTLYQRIAQHAPIAVALAITFAVLQHVMR